MRPCFSSHGLAILLLANLTAGLSHADSRREAQIEARGTEALERARLRAYKTSRGIALTEAELKQEKADDRLMAAALPILEKDIGGKLNTIAWKERYLGDLVARFEDGPVLAAKTKQIKKDLKTGALPCEHRQERFIGFKRLGVSLSKIFRQMPIQFKAPSRDGIVIDVIPDLSLPVPEAATPKQAKERALIETPVENSASVLSVFGKRIIQDPNHPTLRVRDIHELDSFLKTLAEGSVKEVRILSHMSPGSAQMIALNHRAKPDPEIQKRFKPGAKLQLAGCSFARDLTGWAAMSSMGDYYLGKSGGSVFGFEKPSRKPAGKNTRLEDIYSKGNQVEYRIEPGKKPRFIRTHSQLTQVR